MSYNVFETDALRPGDIVRCVKGHASGRTYLVAEVRDGKVWLTTLKLDWKPDSRFMIKSGVWSGHLWRLVGRRDA